MCLLAWSLFFSCVMFSNMVVVCSEKVENVDTLQAINLMKQFQVCFPQFCYFLLLWNQWFIWFNFILFRFFFVWLLCIFIRKGPWSKRLQTKRKVSPFLNIVACVLVDWHHNLIICHLTFCFGIRLASQFLELFMKEIQLYFSHCVFCNQVCASWSVKCIRAPSSSVCISVFAINPL